MKEYYTLLWLLIIIIKYVFVGLELVSLKCGSENNQHKIKMKTRTTYTVSKPDFHTLLNKQKETTCVMKHSL